jgi:uncharacterized membrane protein YedE/YeeE
MDATLLLNDLRPMHWGLAGTLIAAVTLVLLYVANRRLGISSDFEDVCSLVLSNAYFQRPAVRLGRPWRLPFVGGLLLGGFLSAATSGGWAPMWDAGRLDTIFALGRAATLAWMFVGGLFIGFGTRLAGGCTSGHGIFGLSNFERASLVSTASFMLAGIVTTNLLYRVLAG